MNKKTIRLLNDLQKLTERTVEVIADLKRVDWNELLKETEKITEEDIGKLCRFSDREDFSLGIYSTLKYIRKEQNYPYYCDTGASFKYCKRVTLKDLEGLL